MRKLVIFCLFMLALSGCASLQEKSSEIKPDWITKTPEETGSMYFIGMSSGTNTLSEGRKEAIGDALLRSVGYLGVKVKARQEIVMGSIYNKMKNEIETSSKGRLEGTHIKEIYYEAVKSPESDKKSYEVYVLLRYSNSELESARELLKEENKNTLIKAREILAKAEEQRKEGKFAEVFQGYSFVLKTLEEIGSDEGLTAEIIEQATRVFGSLNIVIDKPVTAIGTVKKGLAAPLKVIVFCSITELLPLCGIPVTFRFKDGRGELDRVCFTDEHGMASSSVTRIDSIQNDNKVEASISLGSLIKPRDPRYESQIKQEQPKSVSFVFASFGEPSDIRPEKKSIALADFSNMTNDVSLSWLCNGLPEVITNRLAQIKNVNILTYENLKSNAEEFDNVYIINGSFQKFGGDLRIIAKITDNASEKLIATTTATGPVEKIFDVQDELSIKIAGALNIDISSANKSGSFAKNIKAYEYFSKGMKDFQNYRYSDAIYNYTLAIKSDPTYADAYNNLGLAYYKNKETDKALEQYEKSMELNPLNERPRVNLAIAEYSKGNKEKALHILSLANEKNAFAHEAFLLLGTIYHEQGLFDTALSSFQKAIKIKPDSTDAFNGLGMAYQNKGELAPAKENFRKAILLDSNNEKAYNNLGIICDREGDPDKAVYYYRIALNINPYDYAAWSNMGLAYSHKGLSGKALDAYQKAIEYSPKIPGVYYNLAAFFSSMKENDLSIECLQKAILVGFDNIAKLKADKSFDNIRKDPRYLEIVTKK